MKLPSTLAAQVAVALLAHATACAQLPAPTPGPIPGGRCAFQEIDVQRYGMQPFRNPPELRAENGRLQTTVEVRYTDPFSVAIGGCPVRLRTYNGELVGPTFRVSPGDVLAPLLDNRLPLETEAEILDQFMQEDTSAFLAMRPYSFGTTNIHYHGMHVSPEGASDNVLLAIAPQTRFPYEVALPADHTRGTYWYHAHTHGSTAIQVGSGMAGALIVEDDPATLPPALRAASEREKIFVIQTLLYDTAGETNTIAAFFPDNATTAQACARGEPTCTWLNSRRRITVNGQIVPVITMRPGEVQRWRMIDAAFRETISLQLEGHPLHEIATDGIYTGRIDRWAPGQSIVLFPGYRSDVLVQASATPGTYRLLDAVSSAATGLRGVAEDENVLAVLVVEGAPLPMALPTGAEMAALDPFPGVDLASHADGVQEVIFKIASGLAPGETRNYFQVNNYAFHDDRIRYVQLGKTEMWSLTTAGDPVGVSNGIPPLPHVFHIHVNPFQVARTGPDGSSQVVWKDTQVVLGGETVNLYTRYLDFTGAFVMHCHILDHEDLGMMEVVEVVRELPLPHPHPDGRPDGIRHRHGHP